MDPERHVGAGGALARARHVRVVAASAALVTLGILTVAGGPGAIEGPGRFLFWGAISAWSILPYVLLFRSVPLRPPHAVAEWLLVALTWGIAILGIWALASAFFFHLDPQSALVALFLPLWQLIGVAVGLVATGWLAGRSRG